MAKILFVATVHKHFLAFHIPYIKWLKGQGHMVHVAANGGDVDIPYVDKKIVFGIQRSPLSYKNIKAYIDLKNIVEKENYDLVHCHTAMGAVIARLASRCNRKRGITKVLYTAHGFHFFKGSPIQYWLMYYPMEVLLSRCTDGIITINEEDYSMIKTDAFKQKQSYKIPGIGIDTARFIIPTPGQKQMIRAEYGYRKDDFILIYVAEHIPRKNHKFIIDAVPSLIDNIPSLKVLFAGRGRLVNATLQYIEEKGLQNYIEVLGFRKDIGNIIALSDIGISASRQEGLPMNVAEKMFCGLPVVVSVDRGHKEMIIMGENGYIFAQNNTEEFTQYIIELYENNSLRDKMGLKAQQSIKKFELNNSLKEMIKIYNEYV